MNISVLTSLITQFVLNLIKIDIIEKLFKALRDATNR